MSNVPQYILGLHRLFCSYFLRELIYPDSILLNPDGILLQSVSLTNVHHFK